jgi:S-adenosyl-L-methionine hydrolase (adenosine-forming)
MRRGTNVVALLTDFGLADHYVGTMKAVILARNPAAAIVDISHEVLPQNVRHGGYLLWAAYKFFPRGTVFACVVDPGVGTSRKILAVKVDRYMFVVPDNGIFDFVASDENIIDSVIIEFDEARGRSNRSVFLKEISSTFHGRDVFAPVAAYLSMGNSYRALGKKVRIPKRSSPFVDIPGMAGSPGILNIDHFGNIVTNIRIKNYNQLQSFALSVGGHPVRKLFRTYAEAPERRPFLMRSSSGLVEIAVKNGSAARTLFATFDSRIRIVSRTSS